MNTFTDDYTGYKPQQDRQVSEAARLSANDQTVVPGAFTGGSQGLAGARSAWSVASQALGAPFRTLELRPSELSYPNAWTLTEGFGTNLGTTTQTASAGLTPIQDIAKRIKALTYRDLEALRAALDYQLDFPPGESVLTVTLDGLMLAADALEA